MFTLSVAVGGALGSVARAWLAIILARITGPEFPWGTILINILGSFVIGFFGALTASEGRFAVPADVRAFVMIGICGGFTTFSSFSLQTLDLIRDGRPLQALGNIAISVIVCLAAVAFGTYGAIALRTPPTTAAATLPGKVLAVLDRPAEATSLLNTAAALLAINGGGRLQILALHTPQATPILPSEEILTAERRAEQEHWADQLKAIATAWRADTPADWLDLEGDPATLLAAQGREADAIVIARPAPHETERMRHALHAALFDTETPVLVVPPNHQGPIGKTIAIAWQNDGRAEKSLQAALPLLRQAHQIRVLSAERPAETPAILQAHGIQATLHDVSDGPAPTAERLLQAAHRIGADLLVMGAYAHGEWREAFFGGVTRTMLAEADLPLFLRH